MLRTTIVFGFCLLLLAPTLSAAHTTPAAPGVDIALLLDTSNSMDGLINQAKSQLWTIVQEFAAAKKAGCAPALRVALFEYGNTNLPAREGYIRQVVPLGDDLDALSEALFALQTKGGDEYCGQVIDEAITRLDWTAAADSYRAIFIAGNEPFTQGGVDFHDSCGRAVERSIVVNTIHCGDHRTGVDGKWAEGARLGRGEALNIDQDREVVQIRCPQDDRILRLNEDLNGTYIWFGAKKERDYFGSNQSVQDENAGSLSPSVAVKRSITKAGAMYRNSGRDLVDSYADDRDILDKVPTANLPEDMQAMTPDQRREHLESMRAERQEIQAEIAQLAAARDEYLAAEMQRRAAAGDDETLGGAIVKAVRTQLAGAGFDR
ncbi:VWA domain-containing protein [bacterium]|nr:VWA domain-containing protein [bacterium]